MHILVALWLPILLSAVIVFVISCLIHMALKWHAFDYKGFANEDEVRAALGADNVPGVKYVVPYCGDMKEMGSETMKRKFAEGPIAIITFGHKGQPNLGKLMGLWFVWSLIIAAVAAYLTARVVPIEQTLRAAKFAGGITFVAHGFGSVQESIWMHRSWRSTATYLADALLYGLGTGAIFYWLWR
jgi:hypothetical protein